MADTWKPPADAKVTIVCAACRYGVFVAAGPRHFDETMTRQINAYLRAEGFDLDPGVYAIFEQGFIDQYGRFYSRTEAMEIVRGNGQPFDLARNGSVDMLFSEGLY